MTEKNIDVSKPYFDDIPHFECKIVRNKNRDILYYLFTPSNYAAFDWALGNLYNAVKWGRSFIVSEVRGRKLKGYMVHKEQFSVVTPVS